MHHKHTMRWLETVAVYGLAPLIILYFHQRSLMIAFLWGGAALIYYLLKTSPNFSYAAEWNWAGAKRGFPTVFTRFLLITPLIIGFTLLHDPGKFLSFPIQRPILWAMVMILYPILSVWPQEMIFRSFLHHRCIQLNCLRYFPLLSAITFGYAHILFLNWVAIFFTFCGGYFFALHYLRHRSLALACIEHALYGCLLFTVGLGWYFYGAAWGK